ncbi:MAG: glycoside hydrolase family 38 C-terminal domain-containing protein, partial [Anaerolineae bacterium]|nr:glycoside hydrolase family 38 C-terminal domain-containing protein [Anaerolineae bacterium]
MSGRLPATGTLKKQTLYMIGNAHIDPVWLWQWHEGLQEIKATFRSALDLLAEYDDFVFTASSAAFYAWVEENEPEMFAEIQAYVAEGRWEIVGGWWVEPDCNIPAGESFVRQSLYGQRFFMSRFGKTSRIGYNPDSFGHNATIPQILKGCGLQYYVFMRPGPHENHTLHTLFWWEAVDGSRVLTYRIPFSYTVWGDGLPAHIQRCQDSMHETNQAMCFYGVGNHGGGPTRVNIETIKSLNRHADLPALQFTTTQAFFDALSTDENEFPIITNELQYHASGCFAAHSGVKRWNRQAENALISAEKWAALANWITGLPYPRQELEKAWKLVLFNQFHDILAGTSIEAAYMDAHHAYGGAIATADHVRNAAIQKLAWRIATPENDKGISLIVFNPHAWSSTVPVETELGWFDGKTHAIFDSSNKPVKAQSIRPHASLNGSNRVCFIAHLPPLGYQTYRILAAGDGKNNAYRIPEGYQSKTENQWFNLEFDINAGCIARLYDKTHNCEVFNGHAARAVVMDDPSDTWSHGIFKFENEAGSFINGTLSMVERGEVATTIRLVTHYENSHLVQEFTLYEDIPRIDVNVIVDWQEQFKAVKLCFPYNLSEVTATYEIPYGHIERPPHGMEEPGQTWVDVSGQHPDLHSVYGVGLLNDGKYSFSVTNAECCLTVLRSPIYAHHVPHHPEPGRLYNFIDQGFQEFKYSLLPHMGSWENTRIVQTAAELNQPAFALKDCYHPRGYLPQHDSILEVTPGNVLITAVKLAEDNDDLIVRCVEAHHKATVAELSLLDHAHKLAIAFKPGEIKTLRIPKDC